MAIWHVPTFTNNEYECKDTNAMLESVMYCSGEYEIDAPKLFELPCSLKYLSINDIPTIDDRVLEKLSMLTIWIRDRCIRESGPCTSYFRKHLYQSFDFIGSNCLNVSCNLVTMTSL